MLILIVVIAILATNLFLGFFVAHYLGYGPQNLDELWTGVYLRPVGAGGPDSYSQPVNRVVLDALTQAAAARPLLPSETITQHRSESAKAMLSDDELVKTMMHANLALHQAGLLIDRQRLIEPHPSATFEGFPDFEWNSDDLKESLETWLAWLRNANPAEEIRWWNSYVATWISTYTAWSEYQRCLKSLRRIREAEQNYSEKLTTVVCNDGGCRLVDKQPARGSWWQRSSADLRTLTWVHGQLERLHQEAFDHFILFRQESRQLCERTLSWSRLTFKPERLAGWVANFDQRWSWAGLPAAITDVNKQDGYLVVLGTRVDWVAEYGWGGVVADAVLQHRTECLNRWFESVPSVSSDTVLPLRQIIHDRAVAMWISSQNPETARIAAWTIADKLELSRRQMAGQDVQLPCRVLVVPLSPQRPAVVAIRQSARILDQTEQAIWKNSSGLVWSLERRGLESVARPDSLPLFESTMDLAQWYVGWRLGIGFSMPQPTAAPDENSAERILPPSATTRSSAVTNDAPAADSGNSDPTPIDDDGIEW
ncbi:MAG: hypothetical protein Q8M16_03250 [Pirellulaceae bacterium]|nr:hypothetical protein [Pirellulaceae bacterium]